MDFAFHSGMKVNHRWNSLSSVCCSTFLSYCQQSLKAAAEWEWGGHVRLWLWKKFFIHPEITILLLSFKSFSRHKSIHFIVAASLMCIFAGCCEILCFFIEYLLAFWLWLTKQRHFCVCVCLFWVVKPHNMCRGIYSCDNCAVKRWREQSKASITAEWEQCCTAVESPTENCIAVFKNVACPVLIKNRVMCRRLTFCFCSCFLSSEGV